MNFRVQIVKLMQIGAVRRVIVKRDLKMMVNFQNAYVGLFKNSLKIYIYIYIY